MRPFYFLIGLGGLIAVTGPAIARSAPEQPAPAASPASPEDPDKLICRREKVTGSRLPGPRVCRTAEQWRNSVGDQDAVRNFQKNKGIIAP